MVGVGVVSLITVFAASLKAVDRRHDRPRLRRRPGGDHRRRSAAGAQPAARRRRGRPARGGQAVAASAGAWPGSTGTTTEPWIDPAQPRGARPRRAAGVLGDRRRRRGGGLGRRGRRPRLGVGDEVPVAFADGTSSTFTVGAIYDENGVRRRRGLPRSRRGRRPTPQALDAARSSASPTACRAEGRGGGGDGSRPLRRPVGGGPGRVPNESTAAIVDSLLGLVYVLLALAIVIALMGIANTLSLSIHERPVSSACCGPWARPGARSGRWSGGSRCPASTDATEGVDDGGDVVDPQAGQPCGGPSTWPTAGQGAG